MPLDQQAITLDAAAGAAYAGWLPVVSVSEKIGSDLVQLAAWAQTENQESINRPLADFLQTRSGT